MSCYLHTKIMHFHHNGDCHMVFWLNWECWLVDQTDFVVWTPDNEQANYNCYFFFSFLVCCAHFVQDCSLSEVLADYFSKGHE